MATRSTIRDLVRQRADIINDTVRHTDAMLNQYINDGLKRLQALWLKKGLVKIQRIQDLSITGATDYALPTDYLATVGVWYVDGESTTRLRHMDDIERALKVSLTGDNASRYRIFELGEATGNDLTDKRIELYPNPSSGTYKHVYVPFLSFSADTDVLDDGLGWHEYIVLDAAIKVYHRDNLDASQFLMEREKLERQIEDEAEARDLNTTYVVQDVRCGGFFVDSADSRYGWYPDFINAYGF